MDRVQELKTEMERVGRLIEAGHRGIPIGGELLVAFGVTLVLLAGVAAASAFGYLPLQWTPSPLGGAAGFLAFVTVFSGKEYLPRTILFTAVAALAGELAWRAVLDLLRSSDPAPASVFAAALIGAAVLTIALGAFAGMWRLKLSARASSPANRALIGAWLGLTAAMAVVIAFCALVGARTGNWFGFMLLPGLFWVLWGAGWWTSAGLTGSRWMYGIGAASWALALWYAATFHFYSTSLVGLAALAIAPGLKLLCEARTTHEA